MSQPIVSVPVYRQRSIPRNRPQVSMKSVHYDELPRNTYPTPTVSPSDVVEGAAGGIVQEYGGSRDEVETYHGYIHTARDALLLLEGCRVGRLRLVPDRQSGACIRSGAVFVWNEEESGIKRWTDGRQWTPSRISGCFLIYQELTAQGNLDSKSSRASAATSFSIKEGGLIKRGMSVVTADKVKMHLVSYFTREDVAAKALISPSEDPALRDVVIAPEYYPEFKSYDTPPQNESRYARSSAAVNEARTWQASEPTKAISEHSYYDQPGPAWLQNEYTGSIRPNNMYHARTTPYQYPPRPQPSHTAGPIDSIFDVTVVSIPTGRHEPGGELETQRRLAIVLPPPVLDSPRHPLDQRFIDRLSSYSQRSEMLNEERRHQQYQSDNQVLPPMNSFGVANRGGLLRTPSSSSDESEMTWRPTQERMLDGVYERKMSDFVTAERKSLFIYLRSKERREVEWKGETKTSRMYVYSIVIEVFAPTSIPILDSTSIKSPEALPSDIFGELHTSYKQQETTKATNNNSSNSVTSSNSQKKKAKSATSSSASQDYRLGRLSVEWIDLALEPEPELEEDEGTQDSRMDDVPSSTYAEIAGSSSTTRNSRSGSMSSNTNVTPTKASSSSAGDVITPNSNKNTSDEPSMMAELVAAQRDDALFQSTGGGGNKTRKRTNAPIIPTSGIFVPFKTGKTKLNAGIVHLYRDRKEIEDVVSPAVISDDEDAAEQAKGSGTILCILAVPSYMTTQDLLSFVGPARKSISHLRIVRDSLPNRYMVLAKFRDVRSAERFRGLFDGKQFNSLESEVAHVVFVKSVEFKSQSIPPYAFPPVPEALASSFSNGNSGAATVTASTSASPDKAAPVITATMSVDDTTKSSSSNNDRSITPTASSTTNTTNTTVAQQQYHHPPTLVELPTCPVCLERMDSAATGLLTIICHHTFHCSCLAKWGDSSCPVCRYSQQPKGPGLLPSEDEEQNECAQCGATEDLWICLICGHIGCGRYRRAHAREHFTSTQHLYALELETQRVWDYAGDGYVHRLIQNRADGKLVELPPPDARSRGNTQILTSPQAEIDYYNNNNNNIHNGNNHAYNNYSNNDNAISGDKGIDALGVEYGYLLATQLESQRIWYEAQLTAVRTDSESRIQELVNTLSTERQIRESIQLERDTLKNDELPTLLLQNKIYDRKMERLLERMNAMEKSLAEERQLNIGLRDNQASWRAQIETRDKLLLERDKQVNDLQEQLRDIMFYLETQQKVEQSGIKDEITGGQLVIEQSTPSSSGKKRGKSKK
ncbi:hypothetical protein SmJEL517_g00049 [Synchytrium microbalum]|uniref:RING-type domain-containing protein n=1 Tax=Synchytrium microbalum TaxID=1806994 RepID=A0A507CEI2_9FUNG|nr:uncharacterized protein SmJEL517_g00049 [Synchytrium microbalum]TPX38042.1 hypothetical protein SmJEL517_g00049 [Synchytrium microbalum]